MTRKIVMAGAADLEAVGRCAAELVAAESLWNRHDARTSSPLSPHRELDDLWLRWAPPGVDTSREHPLVWYPEIQERLPAAVELVVAALSHFGFTSLGAVLATRIPAGKQCYPHADGGWHAENHQKFAIQIAADLSQEFCFHGESLRTVPGDVFWFDNAHEHWVTNPSGIDRITLIVCGKTDWRPTCRSDG